MNSLVCVCLGERGGERESEREKKREWERKSSGFIVAVSYQVLTNLNLQISYWSDLHGGDGSGISTTAG